MHRPRQSRGELADGSTTKRLENTVTKRFGGASVGGLCERRHPLGGDYSFGLMILARSVSRKRRHDDWQSKRSEWRSCFQNALYLRIRKTLAKRRAWSTQSPANAGQLKQELNALRRRAA